MQRCAVFEVPGMHMHVHVHVHARRLLQIRSCPALPAAAIMGGEPNPKVCVPNTWRACACACSRTWALIRLANSQSTSFCRTLMSMATVSLVGKGLEKAALCKLARGVTRAA